MRALRSFTVSPSLPEALAPLQRLAMNLRWSWDERTRDVFRWVDPAGWDAAVHDPVRLLGEVPRDRLAALESDTGFSAYLHEVDDELTRYLTQPRWFQSRPDRGELRSVGYFSPEFGISEALPQYSGGLGVLAGDHLKAASDLGVPIIGVGLFYRHGYFRQSLSADGWQQERFPDLDPYAMALTLCEGVRVEIELGPKTLAAQVWRADVGRVRLYLLDADIDANDPDVREVTDRLYGGDTEHRIRQEILLGMGGVRALQALGEDVQVFHTNEGHAGFLGLERIRQLITGEGLTMPEAIEAVRAASLFTTHTPVPAGIDRFGRDLIATYFDRWCRDCGVSVDQLMALGQRQEDPPDDRFNMAVMGLRLAGRSNAVAKLHGVVSRHMFQNLWPDVAEEETPITSVTNGVHAQTWVSPEMDEVLSRNVLPDWDAASASDWQRVDDVRDDDLWRVREKGRERLVAMVRAHLREAGLARGLSASDLDWTDEVLDPKALTVGFARRFATYKRANLLLGQPDRLRALLLSGDRPLQFVFAGKAHPADDKGKEMIRQIVAFGADPTLRRSFVFVPDYDISVARALYHGADVWLNNPRRPLEACGTSGMKSALNGGLNCSIMDGWWDELFDGENGWTISSDEANTDLDRRDLNEANSLFELLERQIVPLFYRRDEGPVPRAWVRRVKSSLRSLGPQVTAARMVKDYVQELYEPTAERAERLGGDSFKRAKELAAWKQRVADGWQGVRVASVDSDVSSADIGVTRHVAVRVELGRLQAEDVAVELVHGAVGQAEELTNPKTAFLTGSGAAENGSMRYVGDFTADAAGRYGFTVRVVPANQDLATFTELGKVAWA